MRACWNARDSFLETRNTSWRLSKTAFGFFPISFLEKKSKLVNSENLISRRTYFPICSIYFRKSFHLSQNKFFRKWKKSMHLQIFNLLLQQLAAPRFLWIRLSEPAVPWDGDGDGPGGACEASKEIPCHVAFLTNKYGEAMGGHGHGHGWPWQMWSHIESELGDFIRWDALKIYVLDCFSMVRWFVKIGFQYMVTWWIC